MAEIRDERVCLDERQHGAVLAQSLARALAASAVGSLALWLGWPFVLAGPPLLVAAALVALAAVWNWERTRVVVTTEKIALVTGTLRRRTVAIPVGRVGLLEVEQTVMGRLLGYGTIVAGDLEIDFVPEAKRVYRAVERLAPSARA